MGPLPSLSHPLVIPAFLVGVLVSGAVVAWFRSVKRRGRLCPDCTSTTLSLVPGFPLRLLGNGVVVRWCPGCEWKGLAIRPSHERQSAGGKVRLKGSFRWGTPPPPPDGFFTWSGEEAGRPEEEDLSGKEPLPEDGSELPVPGFRWREKPPLSEEAGFSWGGEEGSGPTPIPFQFAEEAQDPLPPPTETGSPPPIPFRFADQPTTAEENPSKSPNSPKRIFPRLRFRWKG